MVFDELGQALVQLVDLPGELFDALREHSQGHAGGPGHRVPAVLTATWPEACAGAEQLTVAQAGQSFPPCGIGDDQDDFEPVGRLGAGLGRPSLSCFRAIPGIIYIVMTSIFMYRHLAHRSHPEVLMAVPKRKMSRSNTRHRRAQWKATTSQLVTITVDGVPYRVPQRLAKAYERGLLRPEG
ncbi:hypothetical protein GCM10010415_74650 [Streptomyces atrovirens]